MPDCATALRVLSPVSVLLGGGDALQAINTFELPDGALCYVQESRRYYRLIRGSTDAAAGSVIIAPGAGPGRWVRDAPTLPEIIEESGTSHTVSILDGGNIVRCTSDLPVSIMVAPFATNPVPIGESIVFAQWGLGQLMVVEGPGVLVRTPQTLMSFGQFSQIVLTQLLQDEWVLGGLLEAPP